jgi:hypothetical protein
MNLETEATKIIRKVLVLKIKMFEYIFIFIFYMRNQQMLRAVQKLIHNLLIIEYNNTDRQQRNAINIAHI